MSFRKIIQCRYLNRRNVLNVGTALGISAATGVGKELDISVGTALGTSSASGVPLNISVGTVLGTSSTSGIGASLDLSIGSAAGTSAASGVGAVAGSAGGTSSASCIGASLDIVVGTASGTSSASGTGKSLDLSVGSAAGTSSASGVGDTLALTYTLIANTASGTDSTGTTTSGIDTTGANRIIVAVVSYAGGTVAFSDSYSNTWTERTEQVTSGGAFNPTRLKFYDCFNPTVGTGHTFTASGVSIYAGVAVQAWANGGVFDSESGNIGNGAGMTAGSVTPSQDNELIVTAMSMDQHSEGTLAIDSGFTISDVLSYLDVDHFGVVMAYLVQTTAAEVDPAWSNGTASSSDSVIACYK